MICLLYTSHWIDLCPDLRDGLSALGGSSRSRSYTPAQVRLIVAALGTHWWLAMIPSVVIVVLILQISLVGDWLRDKLDPKLKRIS